MTASTAQQINIHDGSRAVVIWTDRGALFSARLYVNCPDDETIGDATMVCRQFCTLKGARTWALKTLAG